MRTARFTVACNAYYNSELQIPDSVYDGKVLDYIREHLDQCTIYDLTFVSDLEPEAAVTEDDIVMVYDEED